LVPLHVPLWAVSVLPTTVVPVIVGGAVLLGAVALVVVVVVVLVVVAVDAAELVPSPAAASPTAVASAAVRTEISKRRILMTSPPNYGVAFAYPWTAAVKPVFYFADEIRTSSLQHSEGWEPTNWVRDEKTLWVDSSGDQEGG
jgi:hypothetical protein